MTSSSRILYIDHTIWSTFQICEEKARLFYREHRSSLVEVPALVFGGAFHEATAVYNEARARGAEVADAENEAILAFIEHGKKVLPISSDDERRSLERGVNIVRAYIAKWQHQEGRWTDLRKTDGSPYVEIGFAVYLMEYGGHHVVCVGKIDRIKRSRIDGANYIWETKTTTSSVSSFENQVRPNHQITMYKWACQETPMKLDIAGAILDIIFVSDRKVGGKFADGVNIEKDFSRVETRRSPTDVEEFLFDLRLGVKHYIDRINADLPRWERSAPAACYMYGGCLFRNACSSNLNPAIMRNKYGTRVWEPWRGIRELVKDEQTARLIRVDGEDDK